MTEFKYTDGKSKSEYIFGFNQDLRNEAVFNAENGYFAVIYYYFFLLNKSKVMDTYSSDQDEY